MIQKRLIVKGHVQDVNYRETIKSIAREMKVLGSVRNHIDDTVEIVCECSNKKHLQEFKKAIFIKGKNKYEPNIKDIEEIDYGPATLGPFIIDYGDKQEELIKKFNVGIQVTSKMNDNLGGKLDSLNDKLDSLNDNITTRFDDMDEKYGEISKYLKEINDNLKPFAEIAKRVLTDPDVLITIAKSLQKKKKKP